jgi:hypothetical protein
MPDAGGSSILGHRGAFDERSRSGRSVQFVPINARPGNKVMDSHTSLRIVKLWDKGIHSLESIARKIGRPNDIERVRQALVKASNP